MSWIFGAPLVSLCKKISSKLIAFMKSSFTIDIFEFLALDQVVFDILQVQQSIFQLMNVNRLHEHHCYGYFFQQFVTLWNPNESFHRGLPPRMPYDFHNWRFTQMVKSISRLPGKASPSSISCERSRKTCNPAHNKPSISLYLTPHHFPDAPWCWNSYLHLPQKWPSFVGKYSSTMEHLGLQMSSMQGIVSQVFEIVVSQALPPWHFQAENRSWTK